MNALSDRFLIPVVILGQLACLPELAEDNDNNPKQLDIHSFVNSTRTVFTEIVTNPLLLQVKHFQKLA